MSRCGQHNQQQDALGGGRASLVKSTLRAVAGCSSTRLLKANSIMAVNAAATFVSCLADVSRYGMS